MEIYRFVFSPISVNTYILAEENGECAIIDCGCYDEGEFSVLSGFLEKEKLKPVLLLDTHCHLDHIFGNNFIFSKYKIRAFSHILDEKNRKNSIKYAGVFGLTMDYPPEQEGFIEDMQTVSVGNTTLKALHVPGHSPGSLAFYSEKDGCVFTGDALFAGTIGRTDLPGGDHDSLIQSIRTKLFTLPGSTIVYPGHGEKTDIETELRNNPHFS